jgi:hypothetical protein
MFSEIAEEYVERIEECRQEARRCSDPRDKAAWLTLAEEWLTLALRAETEPQAPLGAELRKQAA